MCKRVERKREGTEGANAEARGGWDRQVEGGPVLGQQGGSGPTGHQQGPWAAGGTVPAPASPPSALPAPFLGERGTLWGMQGVSSGPQGPAASRPRSSLPGSHLGAGKQWRRWLTEESFRFEPAPGLTQLRRRKESASAAQLGGEPGGRGRGALGNRLRALPSAPPAGFGGAGCLPLQGWGWGGSSPPPWRPPWRLRTGRDLVHKARASSTKIEAEKRLEGICCFQMSVVIAVTGRLGLVGLPYTKLTVQPVFIPNSRGGMGMATFFRA